MNGIACREMHREVNSYKSQCAKSNHTVTYIVDFIVGLDSEYKSMFTLIYSLHSRTSVSNMKNAISTKTEIHVSIVELLVVSCVILPITMKQNQRK